MSAMQPSVDDDLENGQSPNVIETESLCFNCHKNGVTRLLITRIPFFRDVIISSFECDACGFNNRTVDPAAPVQSEGKTFTLNVRCPRDLDRRIVQPSNSEIRLPSLDSSFPCSEAGLTTVEGVINGIIDKLQLLQPERRIADPKQAELLDKFIEKLQALLTLNNPFDIVLDDPSGNGFIENIHAPLSDPQMRFDKYTRTAEQNQLLGLEADNETNDGDNANVESNDNPIDSLKSSVSVFNVDCPNCHAQCATNMKVVDIPHFQSVVLMAINCVLCGYRNNEVKSVAGIAEKGKKYSLLISEEADLSRDVLKSDTARVSLPELGLDTSAGTLGGRFTTVEGLLVFLRDQLKTLNPLLFGDSVSKEEKQQNLAVACSKIDQVLALQQQGIHLELDDPTGNSYLQVSLANSLQALEGDDIRLVVEEYQRSYEQNEELGLLDMNTDNY